MTEERDLVGQTLGHYEIVQPLGAGGMGEVYRARDTNLQRDVAIKVLPETLAADAERLERLRREAHLLASVNHPNIATIYDLEESEGTRWLVLELVEGETLEQTLRNGPFPVGDSLRIGAQVAGALEAAHEKGIVHRDLKSANVMIDAKGRVKVLDFGIAKDISADGPSVDAAAVDTACGTEVVAGLSAHLTATGMIVGTAPYMSPEQIRGHKVDKRVDNWAFGCLMFELLTGRRPFDRETMADTLSAILEHEPDWDLLPADTPEAVEALIRRCLRKDADSRLHDIADARVEISEIERSQASGVPAAAHGRFAHRRAPARDSSKKLQIAATFVLLLATVALVGWGLWTSFSTVRVSVETVAVLPFENINFEGAEAPYYSDALAISVLNTLQRIDGLMVPAWTSARTFRDSDKDSATIGRELGVSKLLSGTVQRAGDSVVVTVELTEVESGLRLWTDDYDWLADGQEDLLGFQEQVARAVAVALDLELTGEGGLRPTENVEAYNAYLDGLMVYPRQDLDSLFAAQGFFEDAVELDEDFAVAHAWLATMYRMRADFTGVPGAEKDKLMDLAEQRAVRALDLDPSVGRAWAVIGSARLRKREPDWEEAFREALQSNANDSLMHQIYGWNLALRGGRARADDAWRLTERAAELDPRMPQPRENLAIFSADSGDFQRAIVYGRQAVALDSQYALGHMTLGMALHYSGRSEGLEQFFEAWNLNPTDGRHTFNLVRALVDSGRGDDAVELLQNRERVRPGDARTLLWLGEVYRGVGRLTDATEKYQAGYPASPPDSRVAQALLALDRGDEGGAVAQLDVLEANLPDSPPTRLLRLNVDMYASRHPEEAAATWRRLGESPLFGSMLMANWNLYASQQPLEPIGYFGVLAGDPGASLRVFEASFPELLADDPSVHAFNLKAAIDLALVHQRMGDEDSADRLLNSAEVFIDSLDEPQRQYQFREAPMLIYALQGKTEAALDAMRQAINVGFLSGWWRLKTKPHFDSIRGEQRFRDMLEELEQLALTR